LVRDAQKKGSDSDDKGISPWLGAKEIDSITMFRTMYWEEVDPHQSEEVLRIIRKTKLITYIVRSAAYDWDCQELSVMTISLDQSAIDKEQQALAHYWADNDQPGWFNQS
jgi:hypothetical protein